MKITGMRTVDKNGVIHFMSSTYNWSFNPSNGTFCRWGKTMDYKDDPKFSPFGNEILDIEVSTICHGPNNIPCKECYKSNSSCGTNMSLETFIDIMEKVNECKNIQQVAFGVGDIDGNPQLFDMMRWCRQNGIVPNITINGWRLTDDIYKNLAELCGCVCVSHYDDESCFGCVSKLHQFGIKQINIHQILSKESLENNTCIDLVKKSLTDERLKHLNAIVFLSLKKVGNRNICHYAEAKHEKYNELLDFVFEKNVSVGFDSCGAYRFLSYLSDKKETPGFEKMYENCLSCIEPCESTLFSLYINVDGITYPCSFAEQHENYKNSGLDLKLIEKGKFIEEVWGNHYKNFRTMLLKTEDNVHKCRTCPIFEVDGI